jgi:hypothetical protein
MSFDAAAALRLAGEALPVLRGLGETRLYG